MGKQIVQASKRIKDLRDSLRKRHKSLTKASKYKKKRIIKECPKSDCVGVGIVAPPKEPKKKVTPKKAKKKKTSKKKKAKKTTKKKPEKLEFRCVVCRHKWS